ncbi:hypothetical protein ACFQI7_30770 [Paenibacillus allorhizosphaerae]|uniref:hypothetical protein n=1 Tax=Paenibacillus allorhizosphaerae TaxID=2849866 RepID=UPI001C40458C|nr:hypothetical protein [Paenibacillus allorhizosphaerae]
MKLIELDHFAGREKETGVFAGLVGRCRPASTKACLSGSGGRTSSVGERPFARA